MDTNTIVVNPEKLVNLSLELKQKVNELSQKFERLNNIAEQTERYWLGTAGDYYRKLYKCYTEDEENLIKRFRTHSENLAKIAANYIDKERLIIQNAEALPGDIMK